MIAMTINHLGTFMYPTWDHPIWLAIYLTIGKLVFPTLLALLLDGYHHTSNVNHYMERLCILFVLSIIPYQLMVPGTFNIMWTLAVCLLYLYGQKDYPVLSFIACCILTAQADWGSMAIPMLFLYQRIGIIKTLLTLTTFGVVFSLLAQAPQWVTISYFGFLLAIPLVLWYNESEGKPNKVFYWFYPLHLCVLWILTQFL